MLIFEHAQWDMAAVSLVRVHDALYRLGFNAELEGLACKLTMWLADNPAPGGDFADRMAKIGVEFGVGVN